MDRLGLRQLLLEPEMLEAVQPDIHLVGDADRPAAGVIPEQSPRDGPGGRPRRSPTSSRSGSRAQTVQAVTGALNRAARTRRPRHADIDWNRTIAANLKHYQPEHRTVVPERLVGLRPAHAPQVAAPTSSCASTSPARWPSRSCTRASSARCWPRCGRCATTLVVFDTAVVDLTDELDDPVDVLFGVQLGGGTDINRALGLLPGADRAPDRHRSSCSSATSTRAASPRRCCAGPPTIVGVGRHDGRPAGAVRLRRAVATTHDHAAALGRPSASRPSPARRTCSPT